MTVGTTRPDERTVPTLVQPPAPQLRRRRRRPVSAWLGPSVTFLVFVGIWYLLRFLLPPPHEVVKESFFDSFTRVELFKALGLSATVAMVGLAIAIVIGMAVAIAMSQGAWVERSLYPYAVVLQCVPILALVPVIGFWF